MSMNIDQLTAIPTSKEEIRKRVDACLDYFARVRAAELGVRTVDLRAIFPEVVFFDDLPNNPKNESALAAFNPYEHLIKLNGNAILSATATVEMLIFHECTHMLDHLLVSFFLDFSSYKKWLKQYIVLGELRRFNNLLITEPWNPEFVGRPVWSGKTPNLAYQLMREIIKTPADFFELKSTENIAIMPKTKLLNQLLGSNLGDIQTLEVTAKFFMGMHNRYARFLQSEITQQGIFNKQQQAALVYLKAQTTPQIKLMAKKLRAIPMSLYIGGYNTYFACDIYKTNCYFELPEPIQQTYLCSRGEIRARLEASKLTLQAIEEYGPPVSLMSKELREEVQTLKHSIRLEKKLLQWQKVKDNTPDQIFGSSIERYNLEHEIHIVAADARTHKLSRSFYPNETVYNICRQWNDKRALPLPLEIREDLKKATELYSFQPV